MAHARYCNHRIVFAASWSEKQLSWRCRSIDNSSPNSRKITFHEVLTTRLPKHRGLVSCCSSPSSTSADKQERIAAKSLDQNEITSDKRWQFGYLVADESWQVRRMSESEEEMRRVASVQAEAFHEPVFLFNDFFFEFFKAEVLSGLLYRLRNSPPDRYACLVAEPISDHHQESKKEVAAVVDVTVQREDSVLEHLHGVDEYLYVSGIAVLKKFRRQKAATTLLQACDVLSTAWGHEYLVLRAYEDDYGAQKLYSSTGYDIVSVDPSWTIMPWLGGRRRVVMVKKLKKLHGNSPIPFNEKSNCIV